MFSLMAGCSSASKYSHNWILSFNWWWTGWGLQCSLWWADQSKFALCCDWGTL